MPIKRWLVGAAIYLLAGIGFTSFIVHDIKQNPSSKYGDDLPTDAVDRLKGDVYITVLWLPILVLAMAETLVDKLKGKS